MTHYKVSDISGLTYDDDVAHLELGEVVVCEDNVLKAQYEEDLVYVQSIKSGAFHTIAAIRLEVPQVDNMDVVFGKLYHEQRKQQILDEAHYKYIGKF